jgi:hypothetical protein
VLRHSCSPFRICKGGDDLTFVVVGYGIAVCVGIRPLLSLLASLSHGVNPIFAIRTSSIYVLQNNCREQAGDNCALFFVKSR